MLTHLWIDSVLLKKTLFYVLLKYKTFKFCTGTGKGQRDGSARHRFYIIGRLWNVNKLCT